MNIKKYLTNKQKEVATKLRQLDEESKLNQTAPESLELGTYSWEADTESTKEAVRQQLLKFAHNLQITMSKIKTGTYGFCERCKRKIEKERLKILPTANLCVSCL